MVYILIKIFLIFLKGVKELIGLLKRTLKITFRTSCKWDLIPLNTKDKESEICINIMFAIDYLSLQKSLFLDLSSTIRSG